MQMDIQEVINIVDEKLLPHRTLQQEISHHIISQFSLSCQNLSDKTMDEAT